MAASFYAPGAFSSSEVFPLEPTPGQVVSFYPTSGVVGVSRASVPELPWTKRSEYTLEAAASVRGSSRERRHRSSWHAALNKRLVAIEDADELLALVNEMLNGFDMLNTVTALNRLSRCRGAQRKQRDTRALEILYRIEAWLPETYVKDDHADGPEVVHPKHLASIATALARLQWKDFTAGRVLRMIASIAPGVLPQARARDLSNLAWAYATLGLRGFDALLLAIAREAVVQIADFTEQNLSNTCWAYAKIGLRHDPLIKAIADETVRKLPQFSAQGLSNTLWGFATMVIKGEECLGQSAWQLICALLEEIMRRLPDCTTQELSNSSWACCRLGVRHDAFMAAIAEWGQRLLPDYTPQDLANTSMAFAKPNILSRAFLLGIAGEAARKMRLFEAREVSNITWSLTILCPGLVSSEWIDQAMKHFRGLVANGHFEGWEVVQLLNASYAHRFSLTQWPGLVDTFRRRVFGPIVAAMMSIVGRDILRGAEVNGVPVDAAKDVEVDEPAQLAPPLSAGPLTASVLAEGSRPRAAVEPLDAARAEAQRLVTELQVDFLGPVFTRTALRELGFVDPEDRRAVHALEPPGPDAEEAPLQVPEWGVRARAATANALTQMKAELPFMWFDRFGPHERRVLCWFSYRLRVEIRNSATGERLQEELKEDGRIAGFSLDEHRAMVNRGCETFARLEAEKKGEILFTLHDVRQAQQWLQGLFAQHDRAGHAERQALLEVVLDVIGSLRRLERHSGVTAPAVMPCIDKGFFDGSIGAEVRGNLRLFVCHFYCISCLAAISNFARRFPHVTLHFDYDDCWATRLLDV